MRSLIIIILGLTVATLALADDFTLKSPAFHDNERIPVLYTCNGKNISPPLSWDNIPANTKSFVLILKTPDWTPAKIYLWTIYNIPGDVKALGPGADQNLPDGTLVGMNFYYEANYTGPCPPDNLLHHYVFTLYALDTILYPIEDNIDPDDLLDIIKPHILKQTELKAVFSH